MLMVFCAASMSLYNIVGGCYQWATLGVEGTLKANKQVRAKYLEQRKGWTEGQNQAGLPAVVASRIRFMKACAPSLQPIRRAMRHISSWMPSSSSIPI